MGNLFKLATIVTLLWTALLASANNQQIPDNIESADQQRLELLQRIATLQQSTQSLRQTIGRQERYIQRQQQELEYSQQLLATLDSYSDHIQDDIYKKRQYPNNQTLSATIPDDQLDSPSPSVRFLASLKLLRKQLEDSTSLTTWSGELASGQQVEFVRLGRVALYFLSPDTEEGAIYLPDKKQWQSLNPSEISELIRARNIALGEESPDWLYLPLSRHSKGGIQ